MYSHYIKTLIIFIFLSFFLLLFIFVYLVLTIKFLLKSNKNNLFINSAQERLGVVSKQKKMYHRQLTAKMSLKL